MSQGEILTENNERSKQKPISMSEEDLKLPHVYTENLHYTDTPIRDEDICRANNIFSTASVNASSALSRYDKETFRKRSISLEDPLTDDMDATKKINKNLKANYSPSGSPCDGRSFASSDDITRDHSDGNWNESQVTILPCPPRYVYICIYICYAINFAFGTFNLRSLVLCFHFFMTAHLISAPIRIKRLRNENTCSINKEVLSTLKHLMILPIR